MVRIVSTFLGSLLCTVWMALPAYIGRSNVSGDTTLITSDTCMTSSRAATRGMTFLPDAVAAAAATS